MILCSKHVCLTGKKYLKVAKVGHLFVSSYLWQANKFQKTHFQNYAEYRRFFQFSTQFGCQFNLYWSVYLSVTLYWLRFTPNVNWVTFINLLVILIKIPHAQDAARVPTVSSVSKNYKKRTVARILTN